MVWRNFQVAEVEGIRERVWYISLHDKLYLKIKSNPLAPYRILVSDYGVHEGKLTVESDRRTIR